MSGTQRESVFNSAIEGRYEIRLVSDETVLIETARRKAEALSYAARLASREGEAVVVIDSMARSRRVVVR